MPQPTLDQVRTAMADIWTDLVHCHPSDDNDFFELGGGSMELVTLMMNVQERFGVALSIDELFADTFTCGASVRGVAEALATSAGRVR